MIVRFFHCYFYVHINSGHWFNSAEEVLKTDGFGANQENRRNNEPDV